MTVPIICLPQRLFSTFRGCTLWYHYRKETWCGKNANLWFYVLPKCQESWWKKFDARSKKVVLVGYDWDSPSYLVYDPDTRAVSIHRLFKFSSVVNPLTDDDVFIPASEEPNIKPESSTKDVPITKSELKKYPLRSRQQQPSPSEDPEESDAAKFAHYCYHINTPTTFKEAMFCPEASPWKQAMDNEFESLQSNDTFIATSNKLLVGGTVGI